MSRYQRSETKMNILYYTLLILVPIMIIFKGNFSNKNIVKKRLELLEKNINIKGIIVGWGISILILSSLASTGKEVENIILGIVLVSTILLFNKEEDMYRSSHIFKSLILCLGIVGMCIIPNTRDIIYMIILLEVFNISIYIGIINSNDKSGETSITSIRYYLLSSITSLVVIASKLLLSPLLLIIGYLGKIGAVPYHIPNIRIYERISLSKIQHMIILPGYVLTYYMMNNISPINIEFNSYIRISAIFCILIGGFNLIVNVNSINLLLGYNSIISIGNLLIIYLYCDIFILKLYILSYILSFNLLVILLSNFSLFNYRYYLGLFILAILAIMQYPPTLGFISKFLLFKTVFYSGDISLFIICLIGSILPIISWLHFLFINFKSDNTPSTHTFNNITFEIILILFFLFSLYFSMFDLDFLCNILHLDY